MQKEPKPPKKKKFLKSRSAKMELLYEQRRPFVIKILKERILCEACKPFATYDKKTIFNQHLSPDVHEIVTFTGRVNS